MALSFTWAVNIDPSIATTTDFASRVQGIVFDQQLELNKMAQWRCQITLKNFDGALTPGGGGTYGTRDWFANMVRISLTVTGGASSAVADVFHGIVTDFELDDDGTASTVTLTCQDVWAVGGRTAYATVPAFAETSADTYLTQVATWSGFSGYWPRFGATTVDIQMFDDSYDQNQKNIKSDTVLSAMTYANLTNNVILPGIRAWAWPETISSPSAGVLNFDAYYAIGSSLKTDLTPIVLHESASGTQIPFSRIVQGWNYDRTINTATVTPTITGAAAQTSQDTTQAAKYGVRAVQYTQTAALTNAQALRHAQWLANAYSTPRFLPRTVTTKLSMIAARCSDAAYTNIKRLFDLYDGFLWPVDVTWTGAGTSTTQTADCLILGRRITVTPSDTTLELTLGSFADNHNWIIGFDKLGESRLG